MWTTALQPILLLLGAGFLLANVRLIMQWASFVRLRPTAIVTWPGRRPPLFGVFLFLALALCGLVIVKVVWQRRPPIEAFGESMMFLYYGYFLPLSLRIGRGFYADGIWADSGFIRYSEISGLSWREGAEITLVLISRARRLARHLVVPRVHYGAARRVLLDKIAAHDIQFTETGLDLGAHNDRDKV